MFVSIKHKILFVAIPKTATRSIYDSMEKHFGGVPVDDHQKWIPKKYKDFYTFTVIRNPYYRAISIWWSTCKRNNDIRGYIANYLQEDNTFVNFMRYIPQISHDNPGRVVTQPQSNWLRGKDFDKMIPFEEVDEAWLTMPFNPTHIPLPKLNPTITVTKGNPNVRSQYDNYLCPESISLVNNYFHEDFELTGYLKFKP